MNTSANNNTTTILAAIGGLLLIFGGSLTNISSSLGEKSPLEQAIQPYKTAASSKDLKRISQSILYLSNVMANNPKIRQQFQVDADPGYWLKTTLELSFTTEYDFKQKYPKIYSVITQWYEANIQDGFTSKQLVQKWRELAEALN